MRGLLAGLSVLAAACAIAPGEARAQETAYDPWEGLNRNLFAIHEAVDNTVLEPVARGYRAVTPRPLRNSVVNFLRNLRSPVIFTNDVLQGEVNRAGVTAARFGVNTTIGVLGIFDPARGMGLEYHDEDFGQTLGAWGVSEGPYVFVPVLGPTNLRDGAARIVDVAIDPLTWAEFDGDDTFRTSRTIVSGVAQRELLIETIEGVRANSVDPYVTLRSSYGLLRDSAIQNGRTDIQDLPEFEDMPEASDAAPVAPATDAEPAPADDTASTPVQNDQE